MMIDKFGKVMIYVNEPRKVADFWIEKLEFIEKDIQKFESRILSVELTHSTMSDASIVLFDKHIVAQMSPEIPLTTPSILFTSYDIDKMREKLLRSDVTVGEIQAIGDAKTFNFADIEGNYFAVEEIR